MKIFSKVLVVAFAVSATLSSCMQPFDPHNPPGDGNNGGGRDTSKTDRGGFVISNGYIDFGVLKHGEARTAAVLLKVMNNTQNVTINSIELEMKTPGFTVKHEALPFVYNAADQGAILVEFTAPAEAGDYNEILVINGTQRAKLHAHVAERNPNGHGEFVIEQYIELGDLMPGDVRSGNVQIKILSNMPTVTINSIDFDMKGQGFSLEHPALPFEHNPMVKESYITVNFRAPDQHGDYTASIVINGTHYAKIHARVGDRHTGQQILIQASDVMFDNVAFGQSKAARAFIVNNSKEAIVVHSAEIGGADAANFSLNSPQFPLMISPGEKFEFGVTFSPTATNSKFWAPIKFDIRAANIPSQYIDNITNVTGACY